MKECTCRFVRSFLPKKPLKWSLWVGKIMAAFFFLRCGWERLHVSHPLPGWAWWSHIFLNGSWMYRKNRITSGQISSRPHRCFGPPNGGITGNLGLRNIVIWPDNMAIFSRMEQLLTLQKPNMDAAKIYQWSWTLESVVISTAGYKAWLKVLCRGIIHFPHLRLIKFSANDPIWGQSAIWETWMVFLIWESWIPEEKKTFLVKYQTRPNTLQWN